MGQVRNEIMLGLMKDMREEFKRDMCEVDRGEVPQMVRGSSIQDS